MTTVQDDRKGHPYSLCRYGGLLTGLFKLQGDRKGHPYILCERVDCSWGYPGVLYSVWTQALRRLNFFFPKDEEVHA
jgi:hypothetical protein